MSTGGLVSGCVFCDIVNANDPAVIRYQDVALIVIKPLNPVVPGHRLVIPKWHIADVSESHHIAGALMQRAARLIPPPFNIITSAGAAASQTVFHAHVHVVPRQPDDGLRLPWTP